MLLLILSIFLFLFWVLLIIASAFVCDDKKLNYDGFDRSYMIFEMGAFKEKYYLEKYPWFHKLLVSISLSLPLILGSTVYYISSEIG